MIKLNSIPKSFEGWEGKHLRLIILFQLVLATKLQSKLVQDHMVMWSQQKIKKIIIKKLQ